jgi:hypothetical protein
MEMDELLKKWKTQKKTKKLMMYNKFIRHIDIHYITSIFVTYFE